MKIHILFAGLLLISCAPTQVAQNVANVNEEGQSSFNRGLAVAAHQLDKNMVSNQKQKVAILPFTDMNGELYVLGIFLTDELIDHLLLSKTINVVDRLHLRKVMEEEQLSIHNIIDKDSMQKLSTMLGADAIVSGSYTILTNSMRVTLRMFDGTTGDVFAIEKMEMKLNDDLIALATRRHSNRSRWDGISEDEMRREYDVHIAKALSYIDEAAQLDPVFVGHIERRAAKYRASLIDIEIALSLFPNDERASRIKSQIENILQPREGTR